MHRLQRPGVDLDSFGEPYYKELKEEYSRMGREMWALDLTSDLGIPTFEPSRYGSYNFVSRLTICAPIVIKLNFSAMGDSLFA